jgi:Predicted transcriptional regulators
MANRERKKKYSISEFATQFDISPRTIRYYEEKGLLSPERSSSNHRFYTKRDRAILKLILRGKKFGFTLAEIKEMVDLYNDDHTEKKQILRTLEYGDEKLQEIEERIQELQMIKEDMLNVRNVLLKKLNEIKRGGKRC